MSEQYKMLDMSAEQFSANITVCYDGDDEYLKIHEISAKSYSVSVGGYARFTQLIASELYGPLIEVYVVANYDGSFKTVFRVVAQAFTFVSSVAGFLGWIGVSPEDLKKYVVEIQAKIIEVIADSEGRDAAIIDLIDNDGVLPEEARSVLRRIVRDSRVRKSIDDFTSPLDNDGYNEISIEDGSLKIIKEQRKYFIYTPPDVIEEDEFSDEVSILYLSPELNEWKFHGTKDFWAEIYDLDFLERTKTRRFSDLRWSRYRVFGVKKIVRKFGAKKGTITWKINKIEEIAEQASLL